MKRLFSLILATVICVGMFTACTQKKETPAPSDAQSPSRAAAQKPEGYPSRAIKIIVPGSAGGAADIGARAIQPFLEKELGQTIVIEDVSGGSGWIAWTGLVNAKPDGYTIGIVNIPAFPAGYSDPKMNLGINKDRITTIANNVNDMSVIAIRSGETRFTDVKSLVKYTKVHELTGTTGGVAGDDHIGILKFNKALQTKIIPVHGKSTPESLASFLGGHVDLLFANVSDVKALQANGEIKVIAAMGKERSAYLPDVPTLEESGFTGIYNGSQRGFAGPEGMDPMLVAYLGAVFENIMRNPDYIEKMEKVGLEISYTSGSGFKEIIATEEKNILDMKEMLGF